MAEISIRPRSALADVALPGKYGKVQDEPGVTMGECIGLSLAFVVARAGKATALAADIAAAFGLDLPTRPRRVENGKIAFVWAGPDQWLAIRKATLNPGAFEKELTDLTAGAASVTEQSDGRAIVRVAGSRARDMLAKGLPIDLHARVFGPGDTALSQIAHIAVHIWQLDESPSYEIAVFRGFARSFWHFLTEAALEFSYEVMAEGK